jgi:hypothetical protein
LNCPAAGGKKGEEAMGNKTKTYWLREGAEDNGGYTVCVSEGAEYLYVDGLDINQVRLPQDEKTLAAIAELIGKIINEEHES